jgi:hypothetical protein
MVLPLDSLKRVLGIALTDASQDDTITEVEARMVAWVEGQTKHRFQSPTSRVEYVTGPGTDTLYLSGHIDVMVPTPTDIVVSERVFGADWDIVDVTEYERRRDTLVRLEGVWYGTCEYRLEYLDGYTIVPGDVQALISELVVGQYAAEQSSADGSVGITSETLVGVYSYNLNRTARSANEPGGGTLSDVARRTLNRWTRRLV